MKKLEMRKIEVIEGGGCITEVKGYNPSISWWEAWQICYYADHFAVTA